MLFNRNQLYVGHTNELCATAIALNGGQILAIKSMEIVAPNGLGGETIQLAVEFGHPYCECLTEEGFWLSLADANGVPAEIAVCGAAGNTALCPNFEQLTLERQALISQSYSSERLLTRHLLVHHEFTQLGLASQVAGHLEGATYCISACRVRPFSCGD